MKSGKIVVALVLVTALLLALASVNAAAEEEVVWEYEGDYDGEIEVKVSAPLEADPGDEITVTVEGEAKEDLLDVTMYIWIEGSENEGEDRWESNDERPLYGEDLDDGDDFSEEYDFEIPDTADPGMILGHVTCEWDVAIDGEETHSFDVAFPMTYLLGAITEEEYEALKSERDTAISERDAARSERDKAISERDAARSERDKAISERDAARSELATAKSELETAKSERDKWKDDYDSLKTSYDSLKSSDDALKADYADLESKYETTAEQLSDFTTYMYILIGSTILFLVTTIIFAVRKRGTV